MKNTLFITAVLLLVLVSCKEKKSNYENCCGTEPNHDQFLITVPYPDINGNLIDSTLKASVYIPNIFVINDPGDNNWLTVFSGTTVSIIKSINFSDENGALLFSRANVIPNDPAGGGWDGSRPNGTIYKGSFNYVVVVEFIDGQQKTYQGKACAYHCNDDGFPNGNLPNCAFPIQHDGNGGWDPSLPFNDCF